MNDVMHLAPYRASIAPGMGAAAVAGGDGFALRRGDTPLLAAHIQRLALPVQNDRGDLRIAEHPAEFTGGGHAAELQLRTPSLTAHGFDVHDRGDVWPFAAFGGEVALVEDAFADRAERFGLALAQGLVPTQAGGVTGLGGGEVGPDRSGEHVEGRRIEGAFDPATAAGAGFGQV